MIHEFKYFCHNSLVISRCLLGWSIHGNINRKGKVYVNNITKSEFVKNSNCNCDENLFNLMKQYFEIDSIGLNNESENFVNNDDRALDILNKTCRYVDGSWEVGLLWRDENMEFPNGRKNALHRLNILERKLDKDEAYADKYYREMDRLIDNGFAIKVQDILGAIWYLPHFGVVNINKPGKVRLVFDAAAEVDGISFNKLLLSGPDLLKSLVGILMRFRQFKYAIKADMKDMFLKVKIRKEDQNAQRFFWRGRNRIVQPEEYVMTSMLFGATSSPCSALYVKNVNANLFSDKYPKAANSLVHNIYMDDYLDSCESIDEARERVKQVIEINKHANWDMHSWASNDQTVFNELNNLEGNNPNQTSIIEGNLEKVLGLYWINSSDNFAFKLNTLKFSNNILNCIEKPTKRQCLSIIMSIFDQ